jgi:hypothetical protein
MPKHPETRAKLNDILRVEQSLDIDALIDKAFSKIEMIEI